MNFEKPKTFHWGFMPPRIMIAAPSGRSGKTIVSIGLCNALTKRGLAVQPFKKGPDYIDASWLTAASGRHCRNLDAFLVDENTLLKSFKHGSEGSDIVLVEGNMGFYDGADMDGKGSSAYLSRLLDIPVILVVDASRMSRSAAALVRGFQDFEPGTNIIGVILNNVSGERHKTKLIQAIENYCHIPVFGAVPRVKDLKITERHLGLVPFNEAGSGGSIISDIGVFIELNLDIDAILSAAKDASKGSSPGYPSVEINGSYPKGVVKKRTKPCVRLGVIYDRIFNFYYPENIEALKSAGADIVYINSLNDRELPEIDGLYIGGGFPELYLEELSGNTHLMNSIGNAIEEGLTVYAECAGLMYLTRGVRMDDRLYSLVGVIPSEVEILKRPVGHGYVEAKITGDNPFFRKNTEIKGHEFHHSRLTDVRGIKTTMEIRRGHGIDGRVDGIVYKNTFAAYTHIHALGTTSWAEAFISRAHQNKKHFKRRCYGYSLSSM